MTVPTLAADREVEAAVGPAPLDHEPLRDRPALRQFATPAEAVVDQVDYRRDDLFRRRQFAAAGHGRELKLGSPGCSGAWRRRIVFIGRHGVRLGKPLDGPNEKQLRKDAYPCLSSRLRFVLMQRFNVSERDLRPGCRDVQVEGELDLAVAGRLDEVLVAAAEQCSLVLVGLERCAFIDSSGIAVILRAHNRMAEEGHRLAVYSPTAQVLRVLSMTGLTSNGLVFDNAEEALAAVGEAD
jgi:anti-sigma B factor antagonist